MNRIIIIVVALLVVLGGVAAAIFLTPLKNIIMPDHAAKGAPKEKAEEEVNLLDITFVQLPELLVNLRQNGQGRANVLKATFMLELLDIKDKEAIDHLKPLIIDQFQTYLRELDAGDLEGAAGLERVRHELKTRVVNLVAPAKIRNILYKDFLIQ